MRIGAHLRRQGREGIHGALEATIERYRSSGQPNVEQIVEMMLTPPTQREVIEYGEERVFAG